MSKIYRNYLGSLQLAYILLLFTNINLSSTFSFNGFEVHDLEKNNYTEFLLEADAWTATAVRDNTKVSNCNNVPLLGGNSILGLPGSSIGTQNQYFQRIYTNLPPHNVIYYAMSFWLIDSWDLNDYYTINFDSTSTIGVAEEKGKFPSALCGLTDYNDLNDVRVFGKISHSNPTLTLRIVSQLDQPTYDESFGLRNVKLIFANTVTAPPASINQICGNAPIKLTTDECLCPIGRYPSLILPFIIICSNCDLSCGACFGPSATECYECNEGYSFNGNQCVPCPSNCSVCNGTNPNQCLVCKPNSYLFLNSTCVSQCESPFIQRYNGNTLMCDRPCSSGQYYYPDSTCLSSCNFPLQLNLTTSECSSPCANQEYLYWDGSCFSNCSLPLSRIVEGGIQLCIFNCNANDFLHINGSCLGNCSFPLVTKIQNGRKFCNYPCQSSEFLYSNGSCLPYCNFPFVQETIENVGYCSFPCSTSKFLYYNKSCLTTCDPPFMQTGTLEYRSCDHPCSNASFYMFTGGKCSDTCLFPLNQRMEGTSKFCDYPCQTNQYLYSNGICSDYCSSPLDVRNETEGKYCDYKCIGSEFLYWNKSCLVNCDPPLQQIVQNGMRFCEFPCHSMGFLYWEGTCSSVCPFPLVQRMEGVFDMKKFCDFDCKPTEYLYWDGSCSAFCDFPLTPNTYKQRKFCQHPCQDPNHFIYPNYTCQSTCPAPFKSRIQNLTKYCDYPCTGDQFLYWNGSCLDSCKRPFLPRIDSELKSCEYPCEGSKYLFWDGTCIDLCESPLRIVNVGGQALCLLPCDSPFDYYYQDISQCKSSCANPYLISNNQSFLTCISPEYLPSQVDSFKNQEETPTISTEEPSIAIKIIESSVLASMGFSSHPNAEIIVLILMVKLLRYINYLDMQFPIKLKNLIVNNMSHQFMFSFGLGIPEDIKLKFSKYSLPFVFERYHIHSNFLVNFGEVLFTLLIILVFATVLVILKTIFQRFGKTKAKAIIEKLEVLIKWNIVIMILISNVDVITLYSSLDFMTLDLESTLSIISFFACIIMTMASLALIIGSFYLLGTLHHVNLEDHKKVIEFIRKYRGYQVLWQGIKDQSNLTRSFMSLLILRIMLIYIIASFLYISPTTQTALYLILSIAAIIYLAKVKPLKSIVSFIQVLTYEITVMVINLGIFCLAIIEEAHLEGEEVKVFLGDLIISCHTMLYLTAAVFFCLKLIIAVKMLSEYYKRYRAVKKGSCLQLVTIFFQQMSLGYEEIKISKMLRYEKDTRRSNTQIDSIDKLWKDAQEKLNVVSSNIVLSDGEGHTILRSELSTRNNIDIRSERSRDQHQVRLKNHFDLTNLFEEVFDHQEINRFSTNSVSESCLSNVRFTQEEKKLEIPKNLSGGATNIQVDNNSFALRRRKNQKQLSVVDINLISSSSEEMPSVNKLHVRSKSFRNTNDFQLQVIFDVPEEENNVSEFSFTKKPKQRDLDSPINREPLASPERRGRQDMQKEYIETTVDSSAGLIRLSKSKKSYFKQPRKGHKIEGCNINSKDMNVRENKPRSKDDIFFKSFAQNIPNQSLNNANIMKDSQESCKNKIVSENLYIWR